MKIFNIYNRINFYRKSQRWNREKLETYQDEKLRQLIRHTNDHVPYYKKLFHDSGIDPLKFKGRVDMEKIPLLDRETVRTHKDELIADNAKKFGINWDSTSGSTGTPLHLVIDNDTNACKLGALIRSFKWAGYSLYDKTFSLQSYYLENTPFQYFRPFNVWRFDSNQLKRGTAVEAARLMNREKPKLLMGFPFDYMMVTRYASEEGIELHSPKAMITYGETLSPHKRNHLESAFGCKIYDFYSHHECVAMISECKHGKYHLVEDFAYNEVVDEDGIIIEDGEGELVGTGLYNYAMPLIRYKTHDRVILNKRNGCGCGFPFGTVKEILGKQNDYLETPDGRVLSAVMSHSIDNAKGVVMSQCVQDAIDHINVNIITDDSYNENSRIELEKGLRKRIGNEIKLDFIIVEQLEKTRGGKTPFIVSRIGREYS